MPSMYDHDLPFLNFILFEFGNALDYRMCSNADCKNVMHVLENQLQ